MTQAHLAADFDFASPDLLSERLSALKAQLPEFFTADGKIDLQALASLDGVAPMREHYRFEWSGKTAARRAAYNPTNSTLTFLDAQSVNIEHAKGNAIVEGENLEVLKLLLAAYRRQVKCIYIDPPYNTGNDFVYDDDYKEGRTPYWQHTGQVENGVRIDSNTESDGRYHSNWLNMIYPRLIVARELLRDDGVIFVSIDDNEVHNLRKVMDEVFGEENFQGQITVQSNKGGQDYKDLAKTHEYVVCYSKTEEASLLELEKSGHTFPYSDQNGGFEIRELRNRNPKFGRFNRPNLFYPIYVDPTSADERGLCEISVVESTKFTVKALPLNSLQEESCWRWGQETLNKSLTSNETPEVMAKQKTDGGWNIYEKYRSSTSKAKTIWDDTSFRTEQGTIELGEIGLKGLFDHPKPPPLLRQIYALGTANNDLILDFFGGSGSTAQAVLELNKADGGNRKFILVQLPELTDPKSEAHKAGYQKISDITFERVKRVIQGYGKKPDTQAGHPQTGFAAYRLSRSHFPRQDWAPDPQVSQTDNAAAFETWVRQYESSLYLQATPNHVLDEVLLKSGFDLARRLEPMPSAPQTVWQVWRSTDTAPSALLCLETPVNSNTVDFLVAQVQTCKTNGTRLIVLAAALDATAKWNLRHAFEKLLTIF